MQRSLYAILLDGGFVTKKLRPSFAAPKEHTTAEDIVALCERLKALPHLAEYELLRIYYYDAMPATGTANLPVTQTFFDLSQTDRFKAGQSLYSQLVLKPNVALRMGRVQLSKQKWRIKQKAARHLRQNQRALTDADFELDLQQKGVDIRIGLDMARLALRDMVRAVVVVTGDTDFVPVFKFVRREGVKVIVDQMGHNVRDLAEHADISIDPSVAMP